MLALESVPVRLVTGPRSGVLLDDVGRGTGLRIEPTEDNDAREAAEDIAAGCSQGLLLTAAAGDNVWSLEVDLRSCCPNVTDRGDFGLDAEVDEGELDSLRLRAFEKLHFFDGVLRTTGADSGAVEAWLEYPE